MIYTKEELTKQWIELYEMAEDEDMDEESWFGMMEAIECDIEEKAEATAKIMKNLESEAEALMKESERIAKRAKTLMNKADWSKSGIYRMMKATGKTKFKTKLFSFGIQKNGGKDPLIINDGVTTDDVPAEYIKWGKPTFDNEAIRTALENGETLEFARLGERGESLRIR